MVGQGMYRALRKAPFVRVFLVFGLGILAGYYSVITPALLRGMAGLSIVLVLVLLGMELLGTSWSMRLFPPFFYLLLFLFGMFWVGRERPAQQSGYFTKTEAAQLIAVVADEPVARERSVGFPVAVQYVVEKGKLSPATGRLLLHVERKGDVSGLSFAYGDKLLFRNTVEPIEGPKNPKQFDYKRYLAHKNIDYRAFVHLEDVRIIGKDEGSRLVSYAVVARQRLVDKFRRFIPDPDTQEICSALILGYRNQFRSESLDVFVRTGTVHVLSVSGLHVGMVFFLLNFLLRFLNRYAYGETLRFILILAGVWSYVLLTGMAPAILRAGTMLSFLLVAGWSGRSNQHINALFASACCLLLVDPFMLFDVGFQLSYLAVLGLFTLYPMLIIAFPISNKYVRLVGQSVFISLSAQLFTTPLALYYFHQFPNYFLLGNLFVSLPAMALMYAGIALAACPFALLNTCLGTCLMYLCRFLLSGLQTLANLPFSTTQGVDFSALQLTLFLAAVGFFILAWRGFQKSFLWLTIGSVGFSVLLAALTSLAQMRYQGLKVYNVGREVAIAVINQGEVALVSTLDSLRHPRLLTHVLPDLRRYGSTEDIAFYRLLLAKGQVVDIQTPLGRVGIAEGEWIGREGNDYDVLLWRNISGRYTLAEKDGEGVKQLLLDASTAERILAKVRNNVDSLGFPYYVLKNNFSYVWEKK